MAGEPLTTEQDAELKRLLRLAELAGSKGEDKVQLEALRKAKDLRANRTLTDDIVDTVKFDPARVAGLTGRYAVEGAASLADLATGPVKAAMNQFGGKYQTDTYSKAAGDMLPEDIFPKPRPGAEEVVAQGSRMVASGGPFVRGGQVLSKAPGLLGASGKSLASQPALQATSAASAGAAGEATRQQGGSPGMQFGASLLAGLTPAGLRGTANVARSMLPAGEEAARVLATVDTTGLSTASIKRLEGAIDKALKFGELDPEMLRRLIDFERVGATPTQASVSLDPVQKTQQKNLAKIGAQSTNPKLQQLAQVENQNNNALVGQLDDLAGGTEYDRVGAGQAAIAPIEAKAGLLKGNVDALYQQARDSSGRAAPLQREPFIRRVDELLMADNSTGSLPKSVKKEINLIAGGQIELRGETFPVPFTVDTIDSLKTLIARSYGANGSENHALSLVRRALDETQLQGGASQEAMIAFDKGRAASKALFDWSQSTPGIKAVTRKGSVPPDQYLDKFIIGKSAAVDDVAKLVSEIKADPAAFEALKFQVAAWLKDQAVPGYTAGQGALRASSMNNALKKIGDRKLALFFSPDEIETIKATNRVAFYEAYQPPGSAINNSNSATTLTGGLLNAISDRNPTARLIGTGLKGIDSLMFNPGRARQQLNPNLMQGSSGTPLLPSLATPMALPLLPQPNRDANR